MSPLHPDELVQPSQEFGHFGVHAGLPPPATPLPPRGDAVENMLAVLHAREGPPAVPRARVHPPVQPARAGHPRGDFEGAVACGGGARGHFVHLH